MKKNQGGVRFDGKGAVVELLKVADPEFREKLLQNVSNLDPHMAEELKNRVFQFNDLIKMEKRDLQTLLTQTHFEVLEVALRGAPRPLVEKILSAFSERRAQDLQESIEQGQARKRSDVYAAQQMICDLAMDLERRGLIRLQREADQWV